MEFFKYNTKEEYLIALGIVVGTYIFKRLISKGLTSVIFTFLRKSSAGLKVQALDDLVKKPFQRLIWIIGLYIAYSTLHFDFLDFTILKDGELTVSQFINEAFQTICAFHLIWMLLRFVDFFAMILMEKASLTETKEDDQLIPFITDSLKVFIIILGFFVILGAIFNVNVAALVGGLGIGGLAIALAGKESLENLIASVIIFLDKPFLVGDYVKVGELDGVIEKIGFRSTRIRTLEKSFVTLPNKDLINQPLDNLTLRTARRVKFNLGLAYDTPAEKMKQISQRIEAFIITHPKTQDDKPNIKFHEFGASALQILVLYYINEVDWDIYLDVREEINYQILQIVQEEKAEIAYPTQTLHIFKES
jgi:MscS family membrane protein